jgi:hypothetical protein
MSFGIIRIMPTSDEVAVEFTKPLPQKQVESFRYNLNLDKLLFVIEGGIEVFTKFVPCNVAMCVY